MSKVFGIGLNKTGTTTLGKSLYHLGYNHLFCPTPCIRTLLKDVQEKNDFNWLLQHANAYDSFEDWPWPLVYQYMDQLYSNSKFILTVRKDVHTWLESLKKHSLRTKPLKNSRKLVYGYHYPNNHEQAHIDFYLNHYRQVQAYFSDRPDDLLILSWENGDGWKKLCDFLGVDIPQHPLPHANASHSEENARKVKRRYTINSIFSRFL